MAPASRLGVALGLPCVPAALAPASRLGTAPGPPRAPVALAPASRPGAAPGSPHGTWARAPIIWLMEASELSCVLRMGSAGHKQLNKKTPDDQAIMISIGARTRVSSKTLRDKGCSACSPGMQQAAH
jgi:hypothetical protein